MRENLFHVMTIDNIFVVIMTVIIIITMMMMMIIMVTGAVPDFIQSTYSLNRFNAHAQVAIM